MKRLQKIILTLALAMSWMTVVQANEQPSVLDNIVERGKLRVGVGSFVPWAFRSKSGKYIGFEIDIANELADDMGVELELVPTAWDGIIPALLTGKFDIIIGGMTATPARNLKINFTESYNSTLGQDVVANSSKVKKGTSVEDLNNSSTTIGVRRGSTSVQTAQRLLPLATIRQYDDESIIERELISGNIGMWVSAAPKPAFLADNNPGLLHRPFGEVISKSHIGMGIVKGDFDTLNFLNNWISTKHNNSFLKEKGDYWFGSQQWRIKVAK
ncbi:MAG: transporter substrate-binding domain-containing protein [Rhizobiales bacterium]|nr:transporter substrate-binding domain-containing protein [Hyphomicrobiales bacterium]